MTYKAVVWAWFVIHLWVVAIAFHMHDCKAYRKTLLCGRFARNPNFCVFGDSNNIAIRVTGSLLYMVVWDILLSISSARATIFCCGCCSSAIRLLLLLNIFVH
jgi:hypothetical protein